MRNHPEVDIVGTDIFEVKDGKRFRVVHYADDALDARRRIGIRVPVAHATVCFRSQVFDRIPGYPLVPLNEDIAMWIECLRLEMKFGNVPVPLYDVTVSEEFWNRRSFRKALSEFMCYVSGIWALDGLSWKYAYPAARLLSRLAPSCAQRVLYRSSLRRCMPVDHETTT
jgi:hypothetical protein